jgi:hypothetical protein
MTSTATSAATVAARQGGGDGWIACRQAFVRTLPLVAIYVVLVVVKDAPLIPSEPNPMMSMVVSEIVHGLLLAGGVAFVETREWSRPALVAGYVLAAVVATVGMLGVFDGIMDALDGSSKRWPLWVRFWGNSGPTFVYSLFAIALYRMWRRSRERAAALRDMQHARVELLRQTAQADLLAMQARIDPAFLFDTLQAIGRAYGTEPAGGRRLIDALIDYLRAVLPGIDSAASTLGKECELARAYLELARQRYALDVRVEVVDSGARAVQFPPMLVLPIVADIVKAFRAREVPRRVVLRTAAQVGDASLAIAVEPRYGPSAETVELVRKRLAELGSGSVTVEESTITLEVPHATGTRTDR